MQSYVACEQAPSEVGKKIRRASGSRSVVTPRAKRVGRTPSSPDRSRLVPLALDYTGYLALNPTEPGACSQARPDAAASTMNTR